MFEQLITYEQSSNNQVEEAEKKTMQEKVLDEQYKVYCEIDALIP